MVVPRYQQGLRWLLGALFLFFALFFVFSLPASAQTDGFAGGATPSRFELSSDPGEVLRRSIEIYNFSNRPARYQVQTADWTYSAAGELGFSAALMPGSCRPWVRLESHEVEVMPDSRRPRPFRFEVHVPAGVKPQECRFALMIGSDESTHTTEFEQAGISLPVAGRIAVIVYVAIGDAAPQLVLEGLEVATVNERQVPVLKVTNKGLAHGRLDADLTGKEPSGTIRQLSLATSPIMPGQTRYMLVSPENDSGPLVFPLEVTGRVYGPQETYKIESVLTE